MKWPGSDIAFSQVREDPLIEHQVIEKVFGYKNKPLDILLIGSGGCTALGLLHLPQVKSVSCIDANHAQLQLIRLRYSTIEHLEKDEQRILLGICGESDARLKLFDKLYCSLSKEQQQYWQKNRSQVAFGVNRVGKFEELFRELVSVCNEKLGFLAIDDPERAVNHENWQQCFDIVFEREKLAETFGRAAVDYSMSKSFAAHFSEVFARAIRRYPRGTNYFVDQIWLESYCNGESGVPPYLHYAKPGKAELYFYEGTFLSQIQNINKKWDIIQTSNISDWMPINEMKEMFTIVHGCLNDGGALIARRLNGDHVLSDIVKASFYCNDDFNQHLWETDRSYFYSEVVVGFVEEECTRC
ncbi:DUF3419 family protein [Candidatus Uabimicrobium amorphum]|uniref:S-adenosylmethionine--diacylglycerol 3-amino-3-carboxypropyl transferase n=1 Tax=Uabimicrobium amorphum TaxID=2596890 RepID=A0A5S9IR37_UABAM|nr:DUF3419 family protein [Candidatus Uabimicrobium amorphum]BBM85135.1 hypothetical protein UABAM_03498 [Candidatus Uabimicrobium amorphum]